MGAQREGFFFFPITMVECVITMAVRFVQVHAVCAFFWDGCFFANTLPPISLTHTLFVYTDDLWLPEPSSRSPLPPFPSPPPLKVK